MAVDLDHAPIESVAEASGQRGCRGGQEGAAGMARPWERSLAPIPSRRRQRPAPATA